MAPARKSKNVNKRYSSIYEVSPDNDVGNSSKSKQRKKLSDKLGSQWSKAELERFYDAYRRHGKDWKKIATSVRNRSAEMVEALYNMNRAYLSLPEGTASVVGLIAMMTDHYNVLGGSDSDGESNDASEVPRKTQKRKRPKVQLSPTKDNIFKPQFAASSEGCLSILKRAGLDGSQPRPVRKRTPRIPVSYSHRRGLVEDYTLPNKRRRKLDVDANNEDVEHVAALLTEASLRGGSPQNSQAPVKQSEHRRSSVQSWDRMISESDARKAKLHHASYGDWTEGSTGSRELASGTHARNVGSVMDMEGVGTVEVYRKGKKVYKKKVKVEQIGNNLFEDGGEACSGTEEGLKGNGKGKIETEVSSGKNQQFSPQKQMKGSKRLSCEDESSALDALHTLANLSTLMLPESTIESESSVQYKDDKTAEADDTSTLPEPASRHAREKIKHLGARGKTTKELSRIEDTASKSAKLGKKGLLELANDTSKSRRKYCMSKLKAPDAEVSMDSRVTKSSENGDMAEDEKKCLSKVKRSDQGSAQSRLGKEVISLDGVPSTGDQEKTIAEMAVSSVPVPVPSPVSLPAKHQNRRKMNFKGTFVAPQGKSSENTLKNHPKKSSLLHQDKMLILKEKFSSCLSSDLARRWCKFEWFYSAIDYPWFAKREFVEYLNHVGLGHIPRLTRVEWGVIRSSLGKPRRFSERFLQEERDKLKQYRESVRNHYTELRTGIREGLATDLARPLTVGQHVIAIHPKTREVHNGKVLTVDHDRCRVQFDRPEIGVEFVMDVDCMPLNPLDNMPEALRRQNLAFDKFCSTYKEYPAHGYSNHEGSIVFRSNGHMENGSRPSSSMLPNSKAVMPEIAVHQSTYGQHYTMADLQRREADARTASDNQPSDKKEGMLLDVRNMNNDVVENKNEVGRPFRDSEPFKKHTGVLEQLKPVSIQTSALNHSRPCDSYPANSLPHQRLPPNSKFLGGMISSVNGSLVSQDSGANAVEVVKGSRLKALNMVDVAIKAISDVKEVEDAFLRLGEALGNLDRRPLTSDIGAAVVKSEEQEASDDPEKQLRSQLITSCVATLLMIQSSAERQYPPADVAQIIDAAVKSLHPSCSQNLPIYREIQMCMGRIKTQILALVPT